MTNLNSHFSLSPSLIFSIFSIILASCGPKVVSRDDSGNQEARQQAEAKAKESDARAQESQKRAEEAERRAQESSRKADDIEAEAIRKLDDAAKKKDEAEKKAEEAQAKASQAERERIAAIEALSAAERRSSSAKQLALIAFDGIWMAESSSYTGIGQNCKVFLKVSALTPEFTRAIMCPSASGTWQVQQDSLSASDIAASRGTYGQSVVLQVITNPSTSTCKNLQSTALKESTFNFDIQTTSGAERAIAMNSDYGSSGIFYISGSSKPSLGRNKSCDMIIAHAQANPFNIDAKLAASLCTKTFAEVGCFTDSGFVGN